MLKKKIEKIEKKIKPLEEKPKQKIKPRLKRGYTNNRNNYKP